VDSTITVTLNYTMNGPQVLTWSFKTSSTGEFDPAVAEPGTPGPGSGSGTMSITKSSLKFNFKSGLKDAMQLSGVLNTAGSAPVAGNVAVIISGMTRNFTLDAK